ncbi:hypothetical protein CSUI_011145, partial [Cystoisospora suis]
DAWWLLLLCRGRICVYVYMCRMQYDVSLVCQEEWTRELPMTWPEVSEC